MARPPRRFTNPLCAAALALLALCGRPCVAQASAPAGGALDVPDVLAGIIHYTRWPAPAPSMRLCVGDADPAVVSALTQRLREGGDSTSDRRIEIVGVPIDAAQVAGLLECQVVYFGRTAPAVWRALLPELMQHPILSIGLGEEFCSYGGLFCLETVDANSVRLRANLDSIARVGLRVNPQLLRLTQRERRP